MYCEVHIQIDDQTVSHRYLFEVDSTGYPKPILWAKLDDMDLRDILQKMFFITTERADFAHSKWCPDCGAPTLDLEETLSEQSAKYECPHCVNQVTVHHPI